MASFTLIIQSLPTMLMIFIKNISKRIYQWTSIKLYYEYEIKLNDKTNTKKIIPQQTKNAPKFKGFMAQIGYWKWKNR